jgi:hypothetical protein
MYRRPRRPSEVDVHARRVLEAERPVKEDGRLTILVRFAGWNSSIGIFPASGTAVIRPLEDWPQASLPALPQSPKRPTNWDFSSKK